MKPGLHILCVILLCGCGNYRKDDYRDNSPTSGRLKVYADEALRDHLDNQAYTFTALYDRAHVDTYYGTENDAFSELLNDSCELIMTSRLPNAYEEGQFKIKNYSPKYSRVAWSGIALITNSSTAIRCMTVEDVKRLLLTGECKDSTGAVKKMKVLFDHPHSSVLHYMLDSILKRRDLAAGSGVAPDVKSCINSVVNDAEVIGIFDYASLSDVDDPAYKAVADKIRFIAVGKGNGYFETPSQSSFKTGGYPFTRTIYMIRKVGDFTLAKGLESFMAGPKGQKIFLKQGLMPYHQEERQINVRFDTLNVSSQNQLNHP